MDELMKDARFASCVKDPRFRRIPKSEKKVIIDNRFKDALKKNKKFSAEFRDKRGRSSYETSRENYGNLYNLSSDEEEDGDENELDYSSNGELLRVKKPASSDAESDEEKEEDLNTAENEKQLKLIRKDESKKISESIKKKLNNLNSLDYARGEGRLISDSSSSDESSSDDDDEEEIEHNWGELDKDAERTEEATSRLALCNMDWDQIRAVDLMVLFRSIVPSGNAVHSVTIYPSEFGLQRMKEEEIKGPMELVESKSENHKEENEENEEGSSYHMEKLRQYQLNRLKYFYAVIVCDSPKTANAIYTECDGIHLELTSTKLDLRFIPEDMEFDQEHREVCTEVPEPGKYKPREFTTTALQQVKVDLTWDTTDPKRLEMTEKLNSGKLDDINEQDTQDLLASGTSEDESGKEENPEKDEEETGNADDFEKYRALLRNIEKQEEKKKDRGNELECVWGLDTEKKAEKLAKEKMRNKEELTPFEKYCEKTKERKSLKKEKRKEKARLKSQEDDSDSGDSLPSDVDMNDPYFAEEMAKNKKSHGKKRKALKEEVEAESEEERKKAEYELLLMDGLEDDNKNHFDIKKIENEESMSKSKKKRMEKKKKKNEEEAEDDFVPDVQDPRFEGLYTSHKYNIDPADQHYRRTKGTEAFVQEKMRRRAETEKVPIPVSTTKEKNKALNTELSALVKSVKRKTNTNIANRI